jgi:hypothetical protein
MRYWLVIVIALSVGCAHTVQYELTGQDRWQGPKVDKVLRIQTFADATTPQTDAELRIDGKLWRTNVRSGYAGKEIATNVTAMITKHIEYSGLFRKVIYGSGSEPTDLELSGTITEYLCMACPNTEAEDTMMVACQFGGLGGLLGLAITAGMKSEIRAEAQLRDVALKDSASGRTLGADSINVNTNFIAHFGQAKGAAVYRHADGCLKQAVAELIRRLGTQLTSNAGVPFDHPRSTQQEAQQPR